MSFISRRIILKSLNQFDWNIASLPLYTKLATFGEGKFVAIGSGALHSNDGINWDQTTFPITDPSSVAYGQGKFVAVSFNGSAAYSDDGIAWTQTIAPNSGNRTSVAASPGRFVAVSNWNGLNANSSYTTNGINWQSGGQLPTYYWNSVAYGNGLFVAVGRTIGGPNAPKNIIAYSSNLGASWNTTQLTDQSEDIAYDLDSVTYGNGKFVAIGTSSNDSISLISNDGINWSFPNYLPQLYNSSSEITYANGMFVSIGTQASAYSVDGINFSQSLFPLVSNWNSIAYGNNRFVVVGNASQSLYTS